MAGIVFEPDTIPNPLQSYHMINTVLQFLQSCSMDDDQWQLKEGHDKVTVYIYLVNKNSIVNDESGYYVGLDLEYKRCWVVGNPNWAVVIDKRNTVTDDGSPLPKHTQAYITSNIQSLHRRYEQDRKMLQAI